MNEADHLVAAARRLSEQLTPGDLDHVLAQVTRAAVELLPNVDYASITVQRADGSLHSTAPTDDLLCKVDDAQFELEEGPCYEAVAVTAGPVTSQNLGSDPRFPRYGAVAVDAGIHSQAGIRLYDGPVSRGALNLYSRRAGAFEDLGALGTLFTDRSTAAIAYAQDFQDQREASQVRETVGKAVGATMERYEFTDVRAFAFLARLAQHHDVALPVVAEAVIAASETRGAH